MDDRMGRRTSPERPHMPDPRPPSSLALWLDESLTGIVLPMIAIVSIAAAGGMYLVGVLSEGATAAVLIALAALAAAAVLRPALTGRVEPVGRWLTLSAAAWTLLLTGVPALATVHPGRPLVEG